MIHRVGTRLLLLSILTVLVLSTAVFGQTPPARTTIPRTSWDGKPDFRGVWAGPGFSGKVGPGDTDEPILPNNYDPRIFPPFAPGGQAIYAPPSTGDLRFDDPLAVCMPIGMPRLIVTPLPHQFIHAPGVIVIAYEWFNTRRVIPLGAPNRPHMPYGEPGILGDSIGWWEGDTLVIDTVNFREGTLDDTVDDPTRAKPFNGMRARWHSDALHMIERIKYESPTVASYEFTIDDSKIWTKPWTVQKKMTFHPTWQLTEYVCDENNRCREGKCHDADIQKNNPK